jgi:hypothetical protein
MATTTCHRTSLPELFCARPFTDRTSDILPSPSSPASVPLQGAASLKPMPSGFDSHASSAATVLADDSEHGDPPTNCEPLASLSQLRRGSDGTGGPDTPSGRRLLRAQQPAVEKKPTLLPAERNPMLCSDFANLAVDDLLQASKIARSTKARTSSLSQKQYVGTVEGEVARECTNVRACGCQRERCGPVKTCA